MNENAMTQYSTVHFGEIFFYLAVSAFWLFVIGLDLVCLWNLRRSRIEATARVLWVVWIILAPIVGGISYFIVKPEPDEGGMRAGDLPFNTTGPQRQRWNENIQR
jgi:heme/copper-type cytochrome/quinol oxidase subunit 2